MADYEKKEHNAHHVSVGQALKSVTSLKSARESQVDPNGEYIENDVFGNEEGAQIKYRTLGWQFVSFFMIAEIVSNGMLSLPSSLAVVGIVPGVILILFLGIFATYTAVLLIDFKLNHPEVHNMGDAGMLIFGPIGREILSFGTIVFAICAAGSELLSGQQALTVLSNQGLCAVDLVIIFTAASFLLALPRTLDRLSWLGLASFVTIFLAGIVAMIGAGQSAVPGRVLSVSLPGDFYTSFLSITNPVFAYAGHFMFFPLVSEMHTPRDAYKSAYFLQGFATTFYVVFAVVCYCYIGNTVQSPVLFSLNEVWSKASFGIGLANFLVAAGLYSHTAAKLLFIRFFRGSRHLHEHTTWGWVCWVALVLLANIIACIFSIAVPVFSYIIGITAALFASWYTYGIAGFFWLFDAYHQGGGRQAWYRQPIKFGIALFTVLSGAFICVAGIYVSVKLIVVSYQEGLIGKPFTC
ncbi:hypothetical protein CALVIDRAFT_508595 [Calocera viscosa TUFC12733]|uniref:Amino acid transporter transmembrane domain-containing protein n=1 Tax=Calocera viscosa (strain TUFC12733) TaxID=1330018 RepID=A0A167RLK6_CALVF|nr:hypothetical protein CALVIDRAFT_508595 [Calocera viscosa TUFC12733]